MTLILTGPFLFLPLPCGTTSDLTFRLSADDHVEVMKLIKSGGALSGKPGSHIIPFLDPQYLANVPDYTPSTDSKWEEPFMPIFPRSRMPGNGRARPPEGLQSLKDLSYKLLPPVEVKEEKEIYEENMVIVNGWRALCPFGWSLCLLHSIQTL
jgi:hypothetical protein